MLGRYEVLFEWNREHGFSKKNNFSEFIFVLYEFKAYSFFPLPLANLNLKNTTAVCGIPFLQHTKDSPTINASWFLCTWEVGKNGRMQVATRDDSNKKDSDKKQLASSSKRKQEQRGKYAFLSWRMSTWTFQYQSLVQDVRRPHLCLVWWFEGRIVMLLW